MDVAIGVDSHKRTLAVAVVDALGRVMAAREFGNDSAAHRRLLRWMRNFEGRRVIGIEGSGNYGAALARHLIAAGEDVREIPAHRTFVERKRTPSRAKNDPDDAIAIAQVLLRDHEGLGSASRDAIVDDLKALVDHHDQLARLRTQNINRAHKHLVVLGYGARLGRLTTKAGRAAATRLLSGNRSLRAELVRQHFAEIRRLDDKLAATERLIAATLEQSGTTLVEEQGIGPFVAASILAEVGDVARLRSSGSFAMLNATAPIPASSGMTNRHRLNRGGNRQLNRALHIVALNRLRLDPATRAYVARKMAEGKSKRDAMRCLKRRLSDVIYRKLVADAVPA